MTRARETAQDLATIGAYALREAVRRRALVVVIVLTAGFLSVYAFGANEAFEEVGGLQPPGEVFVDEQVIVGSTLLGLSMFATLFLGTVLAVFVTLNAVRGDAERGLLQPLVVRPVGRTTLLAARFLAAAAVCVVYVSSVYAAALAITEATGGYSPDRPFAGGLALALAVVIVVALALVGTTLLSTTANGIAIFMIFGTGLAAGLLGQIGVALDSHTLREIASIASWVLPFEAIYQDGLHQLTADIQGATGAIVELGPFGGAQDAGPLLYPYALGYLAASAFAANWIFARADL